MLCSDKPSFYGLPHRDPFLFIDKVTSLTVGMEATGVKIFSSDDPLFRGHFPGNPVVPGVILTEALAQLAGIAGAGQEGKHFLLSAIRMMKFPRAVRPNEILHLHARKSADLGNLLQFEVSAFVNDHIAAEGHIILNEIAAL